MFDDNTVTLYAGDCFAVLDALPANSIDAVVTDPPYHLTSIAKRFGADNAAPAKVGQTGAFARASRGFMGKQWDGGDIAFQPELWAKVLRVLKPGGHVVAFSGTRTYHRMAVAIEDAGFEIRDQLAWVYGQGFPKSQDVSKFIDKALGTDGTFGGPKSAAHATMQAAGVARRGEKHEGWDRPWMDDPDAIARSNAVYEPGSEQGRRYKGWGTALKPAWEPICLARKPLVGTVAENVLAHGVGALNIDGCRVELTGKTDPRLGGNGTWQTGKMAKNVYEGGYVGSEVGSSPLGRWPANFVHDGSDEVLTCFPFSKDGVAVQRNGGGQKIGGNGIYGGSAARFFYHAKASARDRIGSKHPTVKPVALMCWLVRMITPPGGTVLDAFAGTGTTGQAAYEEGFNSILIEREAEYRADIARRFAYIGSSFREGTCSLTPSTTDDLDIFA